MLGTGLAWLPCVLASLRAFRPPFCPNPRCDFHRDPAGWRYRRAGSYTRQARPRTIPRYRCSRCGRSFSSQTFSPTYWLRRPELLEAVWDRTNGGSGFRQIARNFRASPSTVMGQAARLGRHALLFLAAHRRRGAPREALVVDGFESFEWSQYHPLHLNLAVGADSHFIYGFTDAELRRKGRMTPRQKRRRGALEARFGRPDPRAIEKSMAELLASVVPAGACVEVRSDEHPAYPRAWRRLAGVDVVHRVTPSKKARTARNPLFPVNRADLWLRHAGANHRRETIAFSKRRASVVERAAMLAVFLNYQKSFSEKRQDATPAQRLGLRPGRLCTRELLRPRLFPSRIPLPGPWRRYYERDVPTRALASPRRHALRYAR